MSSPCVSDSQLHSLLDRPAESTLSAALTEHLSDCADCRARLANLQAQKNIPPLPDHATPRQQPWQRHWLPAAASILAALLLWQLLPGFESAPQMRSAVPARPLQALAVQNPGVHSVQLGWTPLDGAAQYRVSCYRSDQPAWLVQSVDEPALTVSAEQRREKATSVCRLDAQLVAGDWVLGDEQALAISD